MTPILLVSCKQGVNDSLQTSPARSANPDALWQASFPLTVYTDNTFSGAEQSVVTDSGESWETSISNDINFFNFAGTASNKSSESMNNFDDTTLGIYKSTTWNAGISSSVLAVTQLLGRIVNSGTSSEFLRIEHADIVVNYRDHDFSTTATPESGKYDLETVLVHEFGHFLGLYHTTSVSSSQTAMYPSISQFTVKREPKTIDATNIASKYGVSSGSIAAGEVSRRQYEDLGYETEEFSMQLELHADGNCVHKVNGVEIDHHQVDLASARH